MTYLHSSNAGVVRMFQWQEDNNHENKNLYNFIRLLLTVINKLILSTGRKSKLIGKRIFFQFAYQFPGVERFADKISRLAFRESKS